MQSTAASRQKRCRCFLRKDAVTAVSLWTARATLRVGFRYAGRGVAGNSIWPTTLIESAATENHNLGERKHWRKASVLTDAIVAILNEDPAQFSGESNLTDLSSISIIEWTSRQMLPGERYLLAI